MPEEAMKDIIRGKKDLNGSFLLDIKEIRKRARAHIDNGAVTEAYKADRDTVVNLLNDALATEIVCVLRYKRHYYLASGIHAEGISSSNDSLRWGW